MMISRSVVGGSEDQVSFYPRKNSAVSCSATFSWVDYARPLKKHILNLRNPMLLYLCVIFFVDACIGTSPMQLWRSTGSCNSGHDIVRTLKLGSLCHCMPRAYKKAFFTGSPPSGLGSRATHEPRSFQPLCTSLSFCSGCGDTDRLITHTHTHTPTWERK